MGNKLPMGAWTPEEICAVQPMSDGTLDPMIELMKRYEKLRKLAKEIAGEYNNTDLLVLFLGINDLVDNRNFTEAVRDEFGSLLNMEVTDGEDR